MIKQPRQHNEKHLAFIRQLPCVVCGNDIETEAAHVRMGCPDIGKRFVGKGEKPDDKWAVPLCGSHHRDQHKRNELDFWQGANTKLPIVVIALALWAATGNHELGEQIVRAAR